MDSVALALAEPENRMAVEEHDWAAAHVMVPDTGSRLKPLPLGQQTVEVLPMVQGVTVNVDTSQQRGAVAQSEAVHTGYA